MSTVEQERGLLMDQDLARIDYVTGAVSIRFFYDLAKVEIGRSARYKRPFTLAYFDLDNFKSFTDHYGYIKGSELIRLSGEIIYEVVKSLAGGDAFVGHVGGDDFVAVIAADKADAVCSAILQRFDAEVVKHYSPEDLVRGGIEGVDRYGVQRFFPIMTISIAVIIND